MECRSMGCGDWPCRLYNRPLLARRRPEQVGQQGVIRSHTCGQQNAAVEGRAKARATCLHEKGSWKVTTDAVRLGVPLMLATSAAVRP